jgi:energy-coupling factor transporter ATP-binding protein EcfA2
VAGRVVRLCNTLNADGSTIVVATHDESIYRDTNHRVLRLVHGTLIEPAAEKLADEEYPSFHGDTITVTPHEMTPDDDTAPEFDDYDDEFDLEADEAGPAIDDIDDEEESR